MKNTGSDSCHEDADLWNKVIAGDQAAFESVVSKYQNAVSAVAYSILGNFSLAQEVTQEAFWQAWRQRQALAVPEKLAPWLCGIARNTAIQMLRQEKRQHSDSLGAAADLQNSGLEDEQATKLIDAEEAHLVWASIESLPENYREALVLFYREGESVDEVARILEVSPEAVRQRLSRGREKLRDQLAEHVQDVLTRTRPGRVSVRRIMVGIAALTAAMEAGGTALAAGAGSAVTKTALSVIANTAAKSGVTAGAGVVGTGVAGGLVGTIGGLGGTWLGIWLPAQMAPTQTERTYLEREGRTTFRYVLLFSCLMLLSTTLLFLEISPVWHLGVTVSLPLLFTVWIVRRSIRLGREVKRIRATVDPADDPNPSILKRKTEKVMKHAVVWRSRWSLFGLPLIDVQFASPAERSEKGRGRRATGWIAVGDHATGLIFAYGGVARGLIAFGGIAIGGIAIGGLTVGGVSVGGCALGLISVGGLAGGWDSAGGLAVGYHSAAGGAAIAKQIAVGGFALASDYAFGGKAIANEANTNAAKAMVESDSLRWVLFWIINHTKSFIAIVLAVSMLPPLIHVCIHLRTMMKKDAA